MQNGVWQGHTPDKNLFDSTILIVGLGDIGKNVAKRAKACEMKVIGIKRDSKEKVANVDSIYNLSSIDELLSQVDFVVLAAARTDETFNLFDEKRLRLMKKDALLINVARGALVDEQALIKVLREGHLKGAALDVTQTEPLDKKSPLWAMDNVLITAHSSGFSHSSSNLVFNLFVDNLNHFLSDKTNMINIVDFEKQY